MEDTKGKPAPTSTGKNNQAKTTTQAKAAQAEQEPRLKTINRKQRGEASFTMDMFEAMPADAMRNKSWKKGLLDLTYWPHKHFYRSRDARGMVTKHSTSQSDHFHEIFTHDPATGQQYLDADGYPMIKCGPPLRRIAIRLPDGSSRDKVIKVYFEEGYVPDEGADDDQDSMEAPQMSLKKRYDTHTHEFRYQGSETFTTKAFAELRKANAQELAGEIPAGAQIVESSLPPSPLTKGDGFAMS